MKSDFLIHSYIRLNSCHMSKEDAERFLYLSDPRQNKAKNSHKWIHSTGKPGNVLIRLSAQENAPARLREMGISEELCETVSVLARAMELAMIHFDSDADVLTGIPVYK